MNLLSLSYIIKLPADTVKLLFKQHLLNFPWDTIPLYLIIATPLTRWEPTPWLRSASLSTWPAKQFRATPRKAAPSAVVLKKRTTVISSTSRDISDLRCGASSREWKAPVQRRTVRVPRSLLLSTRTLFPTGLEVAAAPVQSCFLARLARPLPGGGWERGGERGEGGGGGAVNDELAA